MAVGEYKSPKNAPKIPFPASIPRKKGVPSPFSSWDGSNPTLEQENRDQPPGFVGIATILSQKKGGFGSGWFPGALGIRRDSGNV